MERPVTFITGAAGGICSLVARQLADSHELILVGSKAVTLMPLAEELNARSLVLDLAKPESFSIQLSGIKRVTNVIHGAGVVELGKVADQPYEKWQHTLTVNTIGPAELTRLLLPKVRAEKGMIIFLNSGSGLVAKPGWASYAASRFATRALAESLRAEEESNGVRVTSIYPSRTATDMQRKVRAQEGGEYVADSYIAPESIAAAIVFALNTTSDAVISDLSVKIGPKG